MKRSTLTLLLSLSLVFLSGLLVGFFSERMVCSRSVSASPPPARLTPEQFRQHYVETMNARLQLTPEQLTRLDAILDDTRTGFQQLKQKQTDEINAMLTAEQQVAYAQLRKEREERRKREEQQARENEQKQSKPAE
ncbi:MAG: hypothetical protein KIT09_04470 [Bryobacteraceae bacterium]|nr:hypothetical protein [Bryobacteraceae bacterium]